MHKYLMLLLSFGISISGYCMDAEIISNTPAVIHDSKSKFDGLTTLQGIIQALAAAQNVQTQIQALKNLQNFQNDPSNAIDNANSTITSLLNNLNSITSYDTSHITNLSALITALSSSTTAEGMSLRLMEASNMQLVSMQNILQQIQAQQQAIIAYKQAEVTQSNYQKQQQVSNDQASINAMRGY